MTNTSKIGHDYERAWRTMKEAHGFLCTRSAASKGLFDVIAYDNDYCLHAQLKAGRVSCRAATAYSLILDAKVPYTCQAVIVHRTRAQEFCTHFG